MMWNRFYLSIFVFLNFNFGINSQSFYTNSSENGDFTDDFSAGDGELLTIIVENSLLFDNKYLYTKLVKFRLQLVNYEIPLRQYFILHPNMAIYVNDILIEKGLHGMATFYFGESKVFNQTSLVIKMTEKHFNGTLYYGRQVSFLNCHQDPSKTYDISKPLKYVCIIHHDEDIEKLIGQLRSRKSQCATENVQHIHMQAKASAYNRQFIHRKSDRRKKRNTNSVTCVLHLLADHTFFKYVGGESIANTVSEMVSSVMEADVIFRGTDFNGDGAGDNIGFVVGNISLYTTKNDPSNRFSADDIDVYDYLDILTEYDFSGYCLAVGYTHRDFERGIVGLAWVASSSHYGAVGGICQGKVNSGSGKYRSYNTAILTYLNYDTFIPPQKSALTLTHELGHSFGSIHDESDDANCSPKGIYGRYIMDPYTNSGEKPNHRKFSQCSINNIYPVIVNKGTCFKRYTGPICGNSVIEGTEECDCGTSGTCSYTDPCCSPSDTPQFSLDSACTIRRSEGKVCSPVSSPCCDRSCQMISYSQKHICHQPSECSMASYCSGNTSTCPTPQIMPDDKLCNGGKKMCRNGACSVSVCQLKGLEECQCVSGGDNLCKLCCKNSNDTNCDCLPSSTFGITHANGNILYKERGDPCNNFKGFCDKNNCLSDESDSIQSRLKQLFSKQNIQDIGYWFQNFWYYILLGILMTALIGGVYTATHKRIKNFNMDVEAQRYGKLMAICIGADNQIRCFQETMSDFVERFDNKIYDIQRFEDYKSPLVLISRLSLLFPDADINDINGVIHSSSTEQIAVKLLIMKGFSMRKYNVKMKRYC